MFALACLETMDLRGDLSDSFQHTNQERKRAGMGEFGLIATRHRVTEPCIAGPGKRLPAHGECLYAWVGSKAAARRVSKNGLEEQ